MSWTSFVTVKIDCLRRHKITYETLGITSVIIFIIIFGQHYIKFDMLRDGASNHNLWTLQFCIKHQVDTRGKQARKDKVVCPRHHEITYETSGITSVTIFILIFGRNFIKLKYCGTRLAIIIYDVRTLQFRIKHLVGRRKYLIFHQLMSKCGVWTS